MFVNLYEDSGDCLLFVLGGIRKHFFSVIAFFSLRGQRIRTALNNRQVATKNDEWL
jgi:hypothetical protein